MTSSFSSVRTISAACGATTRIRIARATWNRISILLRSCADRFGVTPHLRTNHEVVRLDWDEEKKYWRVQTSKDDFIADVVIAAAGGLSEPKLPRLPGIDSFEGESFHSAKWNHDVDLSGKRVAVVGTGASAIQFVPGIQPKVGKLLLFQRTPAWIMPRKNSPISESAKKLLRRSNMAQLLLRGEIYVRHEILALPFLYPQIAKFVQIIANHYLRKQVRDPELRKKLTPKFTLGCKRILLSDEYLPALTQPNVEVITSAVAEIRPNSVVDKDGVEHDVDVIIYGTGFDVQEHPLAKRTFGRNGEQLWNRWKNRMSAHLGTSVNGFPNLFFLFGPNTALGHSSVIVMIESQIRYVLDALDHMKRNRLKTIEATELAQKKFIEEMDQKSKSTVWASGGCDSWYLDERRQNTTLWPGFTFSFMNRMSRFQPSEYQVAQE
jgi:cation diffusion facilitator CzcD-associated flavoprotein CzcO